ncbi:MAG: hypothetical protein AAF462_01200, partial [Thermodesulfobacteriota bacterium]
FVNDCDGNPDSPGKRYVAYLDENNNGMRDQGIDTPAGFIDICDGAQGPQGVQGVQGPQGPAGNDGSDGATGPQGPQGPAGNDGSDGATGPQGPQGPAGDDGADGATGPEGPQGPAGDDGSDGLQGIQGPAGNDGADGVSGYERVFNDVIISTFLGTSSMFFSDIVDGSVMCPDTKVVLGGGCEVLNIDVVADGIPKTLSMQASYPTDDQTWYCQARNQILSSATGARVNIILATPAGSPGNESRLRIWAICADVN